MTRKVVSGKEYEPSLTKRFNGKEYRLLGGNEFSLYNTRERATQSARAHRTSLHGNDAARAVKIKDKYVVYVHRRGGWGLF